MSDEAPAALVAGAELAANLRCTRERVAAEPSQIASLLRCVAPLIGLVGWASLVVTLHAQSPALLEPSHAWQAPSWQYPLGFGEAGCNLLLVTAAALLRGLALACGVACAGAVVGVPLGAFAGYVAGTRARVLRRACDLVQAFPSFLLALTILAAVRNPTRIHLLGVFALTAWAPFARLALMSATILRAAPFVEASKALGQGTMATLRLHIIPNLLPTIWVQLGASASAMVVSEAALAFVGFGPRDGVSLGALLDQGVVSMLTAPNVLTIGALAVFATSRVLLRTARGLGALRLGARVSAMSPGSARRRSRPQ
jgi:ABC-type dipeptide/oligopeptide/nickel transport system permease subunit